MSYVLSRVVSSAYMRKVHLFDEIQNPFLTAQSTQIKSVISVPIKILFITILGHCLTTYPGSVRTFNYIPGSGRTFTTYLGRAQFNDIPGSLFDER